MFSVAILIPLFHSQVLVCSDADRFEVVVHAMTQLVEYLVLSKVSLAVAFRRWDRDQDGRLSEEELGQALRDCDVSSPSQAGVGLSEVLGVVGGIGARSVTFSQLSTFLHTLGLREDEVGDADPFRAHVAPPIRVPLSSSASVSPLLRPLPPPPLPAAVLRRSTTGETVSSSGTAALSTPGQLSNISPVVSTQKTRLDYIGRIQPLDTPLVTVFEGNVFDFGIVCGLMSLRSMTTLWTVPTGHSAVGSVFSPLQATLFDVAVTKGRILFDVDVTLPVSFPEGDELAFVGWSRADRTGMPHAISVLLTEALLGCYVCC